MASIAAIGTALPDYEVSIFEIYSFMADYCHWSEAEKKKYKQLYINSGITKKYSVLPDFNLSYLKEKTFKLSEPVSTHKRMELYKKKALDLAIKCVNHALGVDFDYSQITHIITVSCTGMWAPGLDIALLQMLGMKSTTERTSVNFMGCYASIHALKMAKYICHSNADAQVLVVSVELCTLHLQSKNTIDNLAANLLFGDGAACVLINNSKDKIQLKEFYSEIDLSASALMRWDISDEGFEMVLDKKIPEMIAKNAISLVEKAAFKNNLSKNDIKTYAIHPGGRKILDVFVHQLQLDFQQIDTSYSILNNFGNMSSATILFVLKYILENKDKAITPIFCAAFGPGLCMETVILDY